MKKKGSKMNFATLDISKLLITSLLIIMICTAVAVISDAASIEVVREEFPVNEIVKRTDQDHAVVSMDFRGQIMVAWQSYGGFDGDGTAVFARSFDNNGLPVIDEFIVNSVTKGQQRTPDISTDGTDRYVIVWSNGSDMSGYDIYAKVITLSGTVIISDYKVSNVTSELKSWPDVAMFPNGDFIVIWDLIESGKLNYFVRLYDILGNALTDPVRINEISSDSPTSDHGYGLPDITVNSNGKVVAVWERITGSGIAVARREFNPYTWNKLKERLISPPLSGTVQRRPMVDINEAGDVLITWVEYPSGKTTGDVYFKKYNAATGRWGKKISPHTSMSLNQSRSAAKLMASGDFIIAWTGDVYFYSQDVFMRFFNAAGSPLSKEIIVNLTRNDIQRRPSIALTEQLNQTLIAITWESWNQDGNGFGLAGKLYRIIP